MGLWNLMYEEKKKEIKNAGKIFETISKSVA
jgi:hypothetical protein